MNKFQLLVASLESSGSSTNTSNNETGAEIDLINIKNPICEPFKPTPILDHATEYSKIFYQNISPNRLYPIRLLKWTDPVDIWISLEAMQHRIKTLTKNLQLWYRWRESMERLTNLEPGTPCAYKDHRHRWRRGMVTLAADTAAFVRKVDVGGQLKLNLDEIKPLLNIFADTTPSAINVRLHGVQTRELTQEIQKKAKQYFGKFGRKLACRFVDVDNLFPLDTSTTSRRPRIELYEADHPVNFEVFDDDEYEEYCNRKVGDLDGVDLEFRPLAHEDLVWESHIFDLQR